MAVIRKILIGLVLIVFAVVAGASIFVASRQHLKFNPPYPEVAASTDTAVIARGHYLVRTLANCAQCHGDTTRRAELAEGLDIPLTGGNRWDIPPGTFFARNITSDKETGIGSFPDGAIARALRYGVGHDGRALLPFMEMQGLSDEDLVAVVSYLRTQPPVHNVVPMHQYNLLGKIMKATLLANPVGPTGTPLHETPHGATVENGRYLVESVAKCGACHTQRDMRSGAYTGAPLGGSKDFDPANGVSWSPPNITNDPTGKIGQMTEDEFVTRFRAGRLLEHSPMPWQGFKNLAEDDIRAIYRYIKTVPPVHADMGPPIVPIAK
jgi:mono/diheme cytochrome c family protein